MTKILAYANIISTDRNKSVRKLKNAYRLHNLDSFTDRHNQTKGGC
nr:MAG TPA_asm: hypothetical protein [Caudoviricetes sp.]